MSDVETRALACKGWRWMDGMGLEDANGYTLVRVLASRDEWVTVALARKRLMAGILPLDPEDGCEPMEARSDEKESWPTQTGVGHGEWWPAIGDPATLGCLQDLTSKALGGHVYVMAPTAREPLWCAYRQGPPSEHLHAVEAIIVGRGVNHAEALVAALEHAERRGH